MSRGVCVAVFRFCNVLVTQYAGVVVVVVWLQAVTGAGTPGNTAAPDAVPLIGQKVGGTAYQKCACGWLL